MDQHQGSQLQAQGTPDQWNDPSFWRNIVSEGDGDTLAAEAQAYLGSIEKNVPQTMRPGFNALETVLLDVARNTTPEVIRESVEAFAGTTT